MKKRIIATLSIAAVGVILLAGCSSVSGSSGTKTVDLTKSSVIASLCGADAASVEATVASAAAAKPSSGQRHTLVNWGITDPTNDKTVATILSTLKERVKVKDCTAGPKVKTATDVTTAKVSLTDAELKAIEASLTYHADDANFKCPVISLYGIQLVQPLVESRYSVTDHLLWPDSLGFAFKATDPIAARSELQTSICQDPVIRGTWLTFLATDVRDQVLKDTGIDLLVRNPRLTSFLDISKVKAYAETVDPLEFVKNATSKQVNDAIKQNQVGQQDAELANYLIGRFNVSAPEARQSIVNYHVSDYGFSQSQFASVGIAKPENRPAFIFALVEKAQCGEITAFGANVGDKRPELFAAKDCTPPPVVVTPNCKTTNSCGTTHTPGCEETNSCGPHPCTSCLAGKTNHIPSAGNDPGTRDDGTGQEPPAAVHTDPPSAPKDVNTGGNGAVDTGTTLTDQSGTGSSTGTVNNGTVTDK